MNDPSAAINNPEPKKMPVKNFYDEITRIEKESVEPVYLSETVNALESVIRFKGAFPKDHTFSVLRGSTEFGCLYSPDPIFVPSCLMFDNVKILVRLTHAEIQTGTFILEQHLYPYISKYAVPHECRMYWGDIEVAKITNSFMSSNYGLIGQRPVENYLDDYPEGSAKKTGLFADTVFDLKDIYEKSQVNGDFPECFIHVKDYRKGLFEIIFLSEEEQFLSKVYRKPFLLKMCRSIHKQIQKTGILPNPYKAILDFYAAEYLSSKNELMFFPEPSLLYQNNKNLKVVRYYDRVFVVNKHVTKFDLYENYMGCLNPMDGRMENMDDVLLSVDMKLHSGIIAGYVNDSFHKQIFDLTALKEDILNKYNITDSLTAEQRQIFDDGFDDVVNRLRKNQDRHMPDDVARIRAISLIIAENSNRILSPINGMLVSRNLYFSHQFDRYSKIWALAEHCICITNYWQTHEYIDYISIRKYLFKLHAHIQQIIPADTEDETIWNDSQNSN